MFKTVPKEIKDEIISKAKAGEKVIDLAKLYGLNDKTIYRWLSNQAKPEISILGHNRLKRENEELKRISGLVTFELERKKKVEIINKSNNIKFSLSDKGSPWQNGYKESFFSRFKDENGDLNRFETLGELVEEIYSYISYYNRYRIHNSLKISPIQIKLKLGESVLNISGT